MLIIRLFYFCLIYLLLPNASLASKDYKAEDLKQLILIINHYNAAMPELILEHGNNFKQPALNEFSNWLYFLHPNNKANLAVIDQFINNHNNWPEIKQIKKNAEIKLGKDDYTAKWCEKYNPVTSSGIEQCFYQQHKHQKEQVQCTKIKNIWHQINHDLHLNELYKSEKCINKGDYLKLADKLIWHGKYSKARKIIANLSKEESKNLNIRLNILQNKKQKITSKDLNIPEILFAKLKQGQKNNLSLDDDLIQLIKQSKQPYPHQWWNLINYYSRELIAQNKFSAAYKLVTAHKLPKGHDYVEAEWLAGWLALRILQHYNIAHKHFVNALAAANYNSTKVKMKYWLARSLEAQKKYKQANLLFSEAGRDIYSFYGQLSHMRLGKKLDNLKKDKKFDPNIAKKIKNNKFYIISKYLTKAKANRLADQFLVFSIDNVKDYELLASIAQKFHYKKNNLFFATKVANKAYKYGKILIDSSYPTIQTINDEWLLEKTMVNALVRQESMFNHQACSPAGAIGLMQLMPKTAQQIAKWNNIDYSAQKMLDNQELNILIGQHYLIYLSKWFEHNPILVLAAYNGGMGNVKKWTAKYGNPAKFKYNDSIIDWIEMIPFAETRGYVQKVLANYNIYYIKGRNKPPLELDSILRKFSIN
jgi:soluble lytic murein transglycosylase